MIIFSGCAADRRDEFIAHLRMFVVARRTPDEQVESLLWDLDYFPYSERDNLTTVVRNRVDLLQEAHARSKQPPTTTENRENPKSTLVFEIYFLPNMPPS